MELSETVRATYTIPEVAQILGVGRATIYRMIKAGEMKAVKLRGRTVVPRAVVAALLAP